MGSEIIQMPNGMDGSIQKVLRFDDGKTLEFAENKTELWLHSWHCPSRGREALDIMTDYAKERGLRIIVPTVLNMKLMKILLDNRFVPEQRWEPIVNEYLDLMVNNNDR